MVEVLSQFILSAIVTMGRCGVAVPLRAVRAGLQARQADKPRPRQSSRCGFNQARDPLLASLCTAQVPHKAGWLDPQIN